MNINYLSQFFKYLTYLLIICIGFSWFAIQNNLLGFTYTDLTNYQLSKIDNADYVDIAIVGDSSAGNGIDAILLGKMLNKKAISLALTGSFGYGGSYIMAKKAIQKGAKEILIVHTVDMPTRPTHLDHRAGVFLIRSFSDLFNLTEGIHHVLGLYLSKDIVTTAIKQTFKYFFSNVDDTANKRSEPDKYDYIKQHEKINAENIDITINSSLINKDKLYYLNKLADYCKNQGVKCSYAHGPIHHSFCKNNSEYLSKV
ncbi:MAG: hypothetical protein H8E98_03355, partial [Bacteroidetes bacterium]|nr:hypothetical protein [Bacteroidota bacterium]